MAVPNVSPCKVSACEGKVGAAIKDSPLSCMFKIEPRTSESNSAGGNRAISVQVRRRVIFNIKDTWPAVMVMSSRMVGFFHNWANAMPKLTAREEQHDPPRKLWIAIVNASSSTFASACDNLAASARRSKDVTLATNSAASKGLVK